MKLRHILLDLEDEDGSYDDRLLLKFGFETRYVCNYLERTIRPQGLEVDGFTRIVVVGCRHPTYACPVVVSAKAASVSIAFDEERYRRLTDVDRHEFFISMLVDGFRCCAQHHQLPIGSLFNAIEAFREGGYRNEWVHRKLKLPNRMVAELACVLDYRKFELRLRVLEGGRVVRDRKVLTTEPDEVIFHHRFKDLRVDEGRLVVTNKFDKVVYRLPL